MVLQSRIVLMLPYYSVSRRLELGWVEAEDLTSGNSAMALPSLLSRRAFTFNPQCSLLPSRSALP